MTPIQYAIARVHAQQGGDGVLAGAVLCYMEQEDEPRAAMYPHGATPLSVEAPAREPATNERQLLEEGFEHERQKVLKRSLVEADIERSRVKEAERQAVRAAAMRIAGVKA